MNEQWALDLVFNSIIVTFCICGLIFVLLYYFLSNKKCKHLFDLDHPEIVYFYPSGRVYTKYYCTKCSKTLTGLTREDMLNLPKDTKYGCTEIYLKKNINKEVKNENVIK
jgi:hypothetical protein